MTEQSISKHFEEFTLTIVIPSLRKEYILHKRLAGEEFVKLQEKYKIEIELLEEKARNKQKDFDIDTIIQQKERMNNKFKDLVKQTK